MVGDLKRYGTVWCYPQGIANILSLDKVREKFKVTFDSDERCIEKMARSTTFHRQNLVYITQKYMRTAQC
jgi:ribosomal protein S17E